MRLHPVKEVDRGTKRRKINTTEYVTIKEIWGKPETTNPTKNKEHPEIGTEETSTSKRIRTGNETLTNCRRVEDKIMEQPVQSEELEWEQPRDWNKMLQERKERMEQEESNLK